MGQIVLRHSITFLLVRATVTETSLFTLPQPGLRTTFVVQLQALLRSGGISDLTCKQVISYISLYTYPP
jgi:hypothetical protein